MSEVIINITPEVTLVQVEVTAPPKVEVNIATVGEKGDIGGQYVHHQSAAASLWTIVHNLGYKPAGILVKDSADEQWLPGQITYINDNILSLNFFNASFAGTAYLS